MSEPLNLFLLGDGVKVADFGLAKLLEQTLASHTGALTPAYAAPEFMKGQVAAQSDQYCLAVSYYELRTGRLPFGGNIHQMMYGHLEGEPDLSHLEELERAVVARALAKEPRERWPKCQAFVNALIEANQRLRVAPNRISKFEARWKEPEPRDSVGTNPDGEQPSWPSTLAVKLGDGVEMEFVLLNPRSNAEYFMGSPPDEKERNPSEKSFDAEKQHKVILTKPFYLAKYLVTQEQYEKVTGRVNPSYFAASGGGEEDVKGLDTNQFPVETVSWDEAAKFCEEMMNWRGGQMPSALRQQGYRFALPTEAQWEYACRAGTTAPFHFGSILNGNQANCDGNYPYGTEEKGPSLQRACKVGSYPANASGLFDMHGNLWQWCQDYYGPYDLPAEDPLGSVKHYEEHAVLRGGSWGDVAMYCRAAYRYDLARSYRCNLVGFRVAFRLH
jgi:formylglycine-generating enzyme required for sulfatase activity